jgi:hypothetical protein
VSDKVAANLAFDEARFALGSFEVEIARNAGPSNPWYRDAKDRATNAIETVAARSDTAHVLTNAGLTRETALADLSSHRLDRLSAAFTPPPLGQDIWSAPVNKTTQAQRDAARQRIEPATQSEASHEHHRQQELDRSESLSL